MIDIQLVTGLDRYSTYPKLVAREGLTRRTAVVQDTSVEDCPDMYFDQALWRALVDYVQAFDPDGVATVVPVLKDKRECSLDAYLQEWAHTPEQDREPPQALMLRAGGRLTLSMITDPWCRVGGPEPYHDSYTYSLFAGRDLADDVRRFLVARAGADRWRFAPETLVVS